MPHADFVHLRVHSAYSLSEGAIKPDKIAALAQDQAMPAVAIADTSNLFGAIEFSQACIARGVQPIIGCQLFLARADQLRLPPDPLVLLAKDAEGFDNLSKLSSAGFLDIEPGSRPQITLDTLRAHHDGLLLLTGGRFGPLGRMLGEGQRSEAESLLASLAESFGDRIAVELERHGLPAERAIEPGLIALADAANIPLVATNECFFAKPEMHEAHDALLCIAEGRLLSEAERRRVTQEHWFKPAKAMRALFADLPEACDNTLEIARRCAIAAPTRKPLLPICPKVRDGATEAETLRAMAREGLALRLAAITADEPTGRLYRERLEFELDVIEQMGFPGYFMIVADFIQWAKSQGIPVGPGRGSGAGSLAAYALSITDIDPIPFNLLFERFLNPERVSMPDFDIDFCQERRDEVIDYVKREYGTDRVAQIITFGKLQARAAVRDVGRVLGMPYGQVNKVAEITPNNPAKPIPLAEAIESEPRLRELRDSDESVRRLLEIAVQVEGLYRHASTHAAGVVIGDRPLADLVPLYRDPRSDMLITQYSMKHVESAGLVKFDFLGLTTLTILDRAVKFLHGLGIELDLARIPLDDAKTYEMLSKGDCGGVFTFETQGFRDVLRQMRPDRFEDLVAAQALNRPGPMANIPAYCARKHGEAWDSPDPAIDDILTETYGILVYQEQVMQIAQRMAGYSLGGADLLRRAMGKKIRSEMDAQRKIFVDGAQAKGFSEAKAVEVFDLMAKFADYGFNKSHAAAYALVSYQTAWLRANHPAVFIAACMSLSHANHEKLASLKQDAVRLGIPVLPPDINASSADFTVERTPDGTLAIRYALAAIKRVGEGAMRDVVAARGSTKFTDLADFATRVDPKSLNRAQIEQLAKAGAFDTLDGNRARVMAGAETLIRRAQSEAEGRTSGQINLFGDAGSPESLHLPETPDWPQFDRLAFEAEAIGYHLTAHPLDAYAGVLKRLGVIPSNQIEQRGRAGIGRAKLAGAVVGRKERTTRTGSRMAWVQLSDQAGGFEVTLFSEILARARDLLAEGTMLLVTAELRMDGESLRITALDAEPLDRAAANAGSGLRIVVERAEALPSLRALLDREGRGKGRILLAPRLGTGAKLDIALPGGFNVSPRLAQAMKMIQGVAEVAEL
ncbi:DNA polymerase III subunit alpha [Acidiphilium sp. AL]|uniref:DNA polymerase III subunit alpha n=1 Tax=Acidiphilium iwatense TaxID=768198 RepID=A0ABS9DTZ1_9PROT|nr:MULTISPECIES: DNA polymerase III subunit alpha [Acidiphilium]MCF3946164.1 DNA polymerase III subunit alpha [Acidiphilium iwatense]MCU4158508.1 DNA polymerase III subunit alpha [Acidiphilium sp. AL]